MRKHIKVDIEVAKEIARVFNCTNMAVWYALNFQRNSAKAQRIRRFALQKGGVLIGAAIEPETMYESDGTMVQQFGQRVKLIAKTGVVTVYLDGKAIEKTMCKDIPEFVTVQNRVKRMASEL